MVDKSTDHGKFLSGFYLGYLRARSFPPPKKNAQVPPPPPPPKKKYIYIYIYIYIVIITVYVTISEISSRRDEVSADTNISQNCVSKCTKLHSSIYSFQKNSGGHNPGQPRPQGFCLKKKSPQTPLGSSWPSATLDFSPKR